MPLPPREYFDRLAPQLYPGNGRLGTQYHQHTNTLEPHSTHKPLAAWPAMSPDGYCIDPLQQQSQRLSPKKPPCGESDQITPAFDAPEPSLSPVSPPGALLVRIQPLPRQLDRLKGLFLLINTPLKIRSAHTSSLSYTPALSRSYHSHCCEASL